MMRSEQDRIRLIPKVRALHDLGPRPLLEFFAELIAGDAVLGADLEHLLDRYARLNPIMVAAVGGRDPDMPLVVVSGGRR